MIFPARRISIFITSLFLTLFLLAVIAHVASPAAFAQSPQLSTQYNTPNLNPDVPRNQHTFAQAALIETISAIYCIITGIDPINPSQGCLDIDPETRKLGLRPPQKDQLGGLIGFIPGMIGSLYTPPASSVDYIRYMANNFGIVPRTYAAQASNGFNTLRPLLPIWTASRNVAYLLFVLIFIIIGLAIMLRVKIDPRTVMTLQNQIPRIIISILLITFSYAIAGLMIDGMWLLTYAGINTIAQSNPPATNPVTTKCPTNLTLQQRAMQNLISTPFVYASNIFYQECFLGTGWGLWHIAENVSMSIGNIIKDLLTKALIGDTTYECAITKPWTWFTSCMGQILQTVFTYIIAILVGLIILLALIFSLLRVWYDLLRAYIMIILYVISAPLWIIVGLLPGRPLGFEKWLRRMFVHLVVFPATAVLLFTAAILANLFSDPNISNSSFVPPLIGQPNMQSFGWLLAFGVILITPSLIDILRQNLKAMSQGGAIASTAITTGIASGAALPKGLGREAWSQAVDRDPWSGKARGVLPRYLAGGDPKSLRWKTINRLFGGRGIGKEEGK